MRYNHLELLPERAFLRIGGRMTYEGGGKGGGSAPTQTVQQSSSPWAGQQPYLSDIFARAQANMNSGGPAYYPGQVTATPDALTTQAQNTLIGAATQQGNLANTTAASNQFNMTNARDVNSNPFLQAAIDAAIRPLTRSFTQAGGTLNQTRDQAQGAGQFGGSRQGVAEGIANQAYLDKVGDVASTMASQGYQSGLDASIKSAALTPQTQQALAAPAASLDAVGQQRNAYAQQAGTIPAVGSRQFRWNRHGDDNGD
jgi:hypothetical protein